MEKFELGFYLNDKEIIIEKFDIVQYLKFYEDYISVKELLFDDMSNLCLTLRNRPKIYENNNFVNVHLRKTERLKKVLTEIV